MKLLKVFSESDFKNVSFHDGFNVVMADISDHEEKRDTHNLGKSSLLVVIDFLLLGKFSSHEGLLSNPVFSEQVFYLELLLNNGEYLVIKRGIAQPSKFSFKKNTAPLDSFTPPSDWDEEGIGYEKAKSKLNDYLGFDILTTYDFRKSITYFLRAQKDYVSVFQLSKFQGRHINWKPFVFELLGYDGSMLKDKLQIDIDIEEKQNAIDSLQSRADLSIADRDKIVGLIDVKVGERDIASKEIDKFNFYEQDKTIDRDLIDKIDAEIQSSCAERYRIGREIKRISESISNMTPVVSVESLKKLYDEVQLFFPESLLQKYEELELFAKAISAERKEYLSKSLTRLQERHSVLDSRIKELEEDRSQKVSLLTSEDVYDKFKAYQKSLASLESQIGALKERLNLIDQSAQIREEIKSLKEKKETYIEEIGKAISARAHSEINRVFNKIITDVVGTNAIISLKQNENGNVEFEAEYLNSIETKTSEADGASYKKLLCSAFDLSLLIVYSSKSFFRFVYHDGIFEGLDNRIKLRLIESIKNRCDEYGLQYILTMIDSDIPINPDGTQYHFRESEICLHLNDMGDEGKLFLRSF